MIGWSKGDENNKAAVIDIARDKWLPRIELQGVEIYILDRTRINHGSFHFVVCGFMKLEIRIGILSAFNIFLKLLEK